MKDIRVELKAKNNALWHCIFDHFPSVRAFALFHKLSYMSIGRYTNLKQSPYQQNGEPRKDALRIANAVGMSVESLFPKSIYVEWLVPQIAVEVDMERFVSLRHATTATNLLAQAPIDETQELRENLVREIGSLSNKERQVIEWCYGLCGEELQQNQIAKRLNVSTSRIGQIHMNAMRKLRHRSRAEKLIPFMVQTGKDRPQKRYPRLYPVRSYGSQHLCEGVLGLDPKSLKGCTVEINGVDVVVQEVRTAQGDDVTGQKFMLTVDRT